MPGREGESVCLWRSRELAAAPNDTRIEKA